MGEKIWKICGQEYIPGADPVLCGGVCHSAYQRPVPELSDAGSLRHTARPGVEAFHLDCGAALQGGYLYRLQLSGMVFTVIGSFIWFAVLCVMGGGFGAQVAFNSAQYSVLFSTYYLNMSIFLAFAATFPEVRVLLMFVIPVKVKWMGILYGLLLTYDFFVSDLAVKIVIGSSLLNFVIFFITSRNRIHMSPRQMKRRVEFKHDVRRNSQVTRHKCAVCGQTQEDDPTLEFRYCSKCNGNYEYCQHHLFTHTHVK